MLAKRENLLSIKKDTFWSLALVEFFTIKLNFDWGANALFWYGSIALLVFTYAFVYDGKFQFKLPLFSKWMISFIILCVVSLIWSLSVSYGLDVIKTLIVLCFVFLFIQFSLNHGYSIDQLLKCYFVATLIDMVYVILTIDVGKLGDVQLGTEMLEGWNGNRIGFMMTEGAVIGIYLIGQHKSKYIKLLCTIGVLMLAVVTMYTGSRTAFVALIASGILYFWFRHPTKMVRNILVTALIVVVAFYLIMNIPAFYNVLGSRFEGLFALFSGSGKVDSSADIRDTFIENGKIWFLENPILGYGVNNYKMLNGPATGRFTYAHNNFIELAVDLGVVGLVWYYSVYVYVIFKLLKMMKRNPVSVYLLSALVASLISHYGTVSYYDFYQNFLLMLCFYVVGFKKKVDDLS